ncbi:BREX system P-loop protein BrxC [Lactobacillus delbrueckii subsp. lactis]|nr:BREX system P-loop protein BrxC [Lactobacillus delbrueckii]MCD5530335.1 BREX system P-loop protein BrxC [Lactobacillus delbrueckii subsp. lactis]MCS8608112.1 BREX system P-loop protein BrxC [Lactobacillus delbrueckii subsp. lactis]MCT3463616.1 BREX system P-loop protein BrxC [Lactobacillus delbrueckii subsp. lactis]
MRIKEMFEDDINRNINGVVKVDEKTDATISQEVKEYVITKELKKHFVTFFNAYSESFDHPTTDIGVWISGFFGSGKSHFLKMLSYILQNKEIDGRPTVDYFKDKFEDDELTFDLIEKLTETKAETILFNIDVESVTSKEDAVIRVFAKMFYNHLGFYGENLKVARLERFIDKKGKTEEFRRVFEEKNGESWLESRDSFDFYEDEVEETLQEVLGMSEKAAENWFNGEETDQISIDRLVEDIREYVDTKPDDFRLLFMADEVGQYVGTDNHKLLNLQSIVEELGSRCQGKVWVVCTGQEAIDQIIKVRNDEF